MPIIGKLLKRTNKVVYLRSQKKSKSETSQISELTKLLVIAKKTKFGLEHNFLNALESTNIVHSFQKNIPITDYDAFHDKWLKYCMLGEKNIIWPGKISHFALSSGTTGTPSKRIPITTQMIRSFQKSSLNQLSMLYELDLPDEFYNGQILAVGGSSKLTKKDKYVEGDLSGILKKYTSFIVTPLTKPSRKITNEALWKVKLEMMVEKAPEWNISIIAGVPSWCILLMEKIIAHYKLDNIHQMWPNLEVYVHGGVFMKPYIPRLERLLGKKITLLDTYLASEGYFAYQKINSKNGMELLLESGVFFEFIPFNSNYFDEHGNLIDNYKAYTLEEVVPEIDYAIVVTTNAGLWRYLIGDLIQFKDSDKKELILTGRIKQYLSLCGEHLSLDNINQALTYVTTKYNFEITEFTIFANEEELYHHWFLGTSSNLEPNLIISEIDQKLFELNDDYRCARSINLKDSKITIVPVETFYLFLESKGRLGAQNKFPRVLNTTQSENWLNFLKEQKKE